MDILFCIVIGKAASMNGLCVTPSKFQSALGEFQEFCPVNLALQRKLIDCSAVKSLKFAAEYRYYARECTFESSTVTVEELVDCLA